VQEIETIQDCELGMVSDYAGDTGMSPSDTDGHAQTEFHRDDEAVGDDAMVPRTNESFGNASVSGIDNEGAPWVNESGDSALSVSENDAALYVSENEAAL
jgi:hypothetical protein